MMTNRSRQAQATKQKLIASAEQLIAQYGYDQVTVDQIVAHCGVAKGTFYHYFKSKEEILNEICQTLYETLDEQASALTDATALQKLDWFITSWHQQMSTYNLHFARQSIKLHILPDKAEDYNDNPSQIEKGIEMLEHYLAEAVAQGDLTPDAPVDTLAKALMFTMQGSTLYHCKQESNFDVLAWCEAFKQHVLQPMLAPYLAQKNV